MVDTSCEDFEDFVRRVETPLRRALVTLLGPTDGREAALDALAYAWENFASVREMNNPAGYLYRVGQTQARRVRPRDQPVAHLKVPSTMDRLVEEPRLWDALARLTDSQRSAVILVHGFGHTLQEAADVLGMQRSSVHSNCQRALRDLHNDLGVQDEY